MKKLNVRMMTKQVQVAETLAKELAMRGKKVEGGIAGRREQTKNKKGR